LGYNYLQELHPCLIGIALHPLISNTILTEMNLLHIAFHLKKPWNVFSLISKSGATNPIVTVINCLEKPLAGAG